MRNKLFKIKCSSDELKDSALPQGDYVLAENKEQAIDIVIGHLQEVYETNEFGVNVKLKPIKISEKQLQDIQDNNEFKGRMVMGS